MVRWVIVGATGLPTTESSVRSRRKEPTLPFSKNLLLSSLSASDAAAIAPHLKPYRFNASKVLYSAGDSVDVVYFPHDAVISLVVTLKSGQTIEAAMVGRDGMVGAPA